jgi:hypothetical protein
VLLDVEGQVAEALAAPEAYSRWGRHYLVSLVGAHRDERCNNFKDKGVQSYAVGRFAEMRDELDGVFNSLPPPPPSLSAYFGGREGPPGMAMGVPVNFAAAFNNAAGGCFAAATRVRMASGADKGIVWLKKGDLVQTPEGPAAVVCRVRHLFFGTSPRFVALPGGLTLTPWHPVKIDGVWSFPACLASSFADPECRAVYNLVLARGHTAIYADGVEACVLGHGLQDDVVRHPYWGTDRVLEDLAKRPGYEEGVVDFREPIVHLNRV